MRLETFCTFICLLNTLFRFAVSNSSRDQEISPQVRPNQENISFSDIIGQILVSFTVFPISALFTLRDKGLFI